MLLASVMEEMIKWKKDVKWILVITRKYRLHDMLNYCLLVQAM